MKSLNYTDYLCVRYVCLSKCVEVREQLRGISLVLLWCGDCTSNPRHWVWWQVPLPTKLSCCLLKMFFFHVRFSQRTISKLWEHVRSKTESMFGDALVSIL